MPGQKSKRRAVTDLRTHARAVAAALPLRTLGFIQPLHTAERRRRYAASDEARASR
jgi:hypothetical protein